MQALLPHQSLYKLFVRVPGREEKVDITKWVRSIRLDSDVNMISTLSFTLDEAEVHTAWLKVSYEVYLWGGVGNVETDYFRSEPAQLQAGSSPYFRFLFSGNVRIPRTVYTETGEVQLQVTAIDSSWGVAAYANYDYAYPSLNCKRSWADGKSKATLKLSDIVKNIVEQEFGYNNAEIDIPSTIDHTYTLKAPARQKKESDWSFLQNLAKNNNCFLQMLLDGDKTKFVFVDQSKARKLISDKLEFVWITRREREFINGAYLPEGDGQSEITKLKASQIQLISATVEEDPQLILSGHESMVKITDFSSDGEAKEDTYQVTNSETHEVAYYRLKKEKVEGESDEELNNLLSMGAFTIPRDVFMKYYEKFTLKDKGIINAIDRPFLGINVKAKCNMRVDIQPLQSYRINGISKYSSFGNTTLVYFLRSLSHVWDDGAEPYTELDFMA